MNDPEGHSRSPEIRYAIYHVPLVLCSNNVSTFHRFRDIIIFTLYVTACDLAKTFSFDGTVEIKGHVRHTIRTLYTHCIQYSL